MNAKTDSTAPRRAWWREPMMWLVVGGPLTVVVAAIVTAVIAIRGAIISSFPYEGSVSCGILRRVVIFEATS